jgi:formylglycine-generating enzyme required for sulfatase activity
MIDRQTTRIEVMADEIADVIWLTLLRESLTASITTVDRAEDSPRVDSLADDRLQLPPPSEAEFEAQLEETTDDESDDQVDDQVDDRPLNNTGDLIQSDESIQEPEKPIAGLTAGRSETAKTLMAGVPFKVNNPRSLRDPLSMVRALKALMRSVPSGDIAGIDEAATARQIAEMGGLWEPIMRPRLEPWLDVVLVADESDSMLMWQQTVVEFRNLLRNYGVFRDVQLWGMQCLEGESSEGESRVVLHPGIGAELRAQVSCSPEELLDPSGRRLILVMTDCVARHWRCAGLMEVMALWGRSGPMAMVQVLPDWLWVRTAMRGYEQVVVKSFEAGAANGRFGGDDSAAWSPVAARSCVPIVPLEGAMEMTVWSEMVVGLCEAPAYGLRSHERSIRGVAAAKQESPQRQLEVARVGMSPIGRRLLGLAAATPVITLPVIRLIQETMLPQSRQMTVAEVLLCGLLEAVEVPGLATRPDEVEYRFRDEAVRGLILADMPLTDTVRVLTDYVARGFRGLSLESFVAELLAWGEGADEELRVRARSFALVTATVLKRKGGQYRERAEALEVRYGETARVAFPAADPKDFPPLQEFEFETVTILEWLNHCFKFETARLEVVEQEQSWIPFQDWIPFQKKTKLEIVITKETRQTDGYLEQISDQVSLKMIAIPAGRFQMGAPEEEWNARSNERPQHWVTVPEFWLGQGPVTQAQWQTVVGLPRVKIELNMDPSRFKGPNLPVEQVSWDDAIEFCARLSIATGRDYRLPSEAMWEYACRAGTTSPFSFGETIDTEVANYNAKNIENGQYATGRYGEYRKTTTPAGTFPANLFGLYDMHGNVWEWCEDYWHNDYNGAPIDGNSWLEKGSNPRTEMVLRGGSWLYYSWGCRAASRLYDGAGARYYGFGFRVCVVGSRSLFPKGLALP